MLRRSPFTLLGALLVVLLLWWSQSGDDPSDGGDSSRAGGDSSVSGTSEPGERTPATMGPVEGADLPTVRLVDLPPEAAEVVEAIDAGGPFAHPEKDGDRFGNYEGLLPERERGWYREYTVPTPGLDHRGARRVVAGRDGELFWTDDHYESFARIRR